MADQAFSRAAGAPLVAGNAVRILRDGRENFPAWEAAIRDARHTIHLEMYIVHRDAVGRRFVDLLAAKAREGVKVRVIYDWFGCGFAPALGLFSPLHDAGAEVRVFNPPSIRAMFGWVRRNHRKSLIIDGEVAFIGGLCLGEQWEGTRDVPPWRDTAMELRGPVVALVEGVFGTSWAHAGGTPLWAAGHPPAPGPAVGAVDLRLVVTEPFTANMFRLDLLVTAMARKRLWISDAYFMGHGPFADALCQAAQDGVDVRLLLPQSSDLGWTVPVARSVYQSLLTGGVRVYEWTGSMMHAKTAVADSIWSRIGSTNLNVNSWLGNWELDVAIEDAGVAGTLEAHFEDDLHHATEITWSEGRLLATPTPRRRGRPTRGTRRVAREVSGVARSVGAALTGSRPIEGFELGPLLVLATLGAVLTVVALWEPVLLAWPVAAFSAWAAITLLVDAWMVWRRR